MNNKNNFNYFWRKLNEKIGFYTHETFDQIPSSPGIYAWYFPLKIGNSDPAQFINKVASIFNYDATSVGAPNRKQDIEFNWDSLNIKIEKNFSTKSPLGQSFTSKYEKIKMSEPLFNSFKEAIFLSTLFLPPLYVGMTNNLARRSKEHLEGNDTGSNSFHLRFKNHINHLKELNISMYDLIFICIKTQNVNDDYTNDLEVIIEEVAKILSKPIYGNK